MKAEEEVEAFRRRSWAEAAQLVEEFEQSGLRRKEFCAAQGLSVHTLDAWRRRASRSVGDEKIVPVELVEAHDSGRGRMLAISAQQRGQLRVVLPSGLRIEVEPGFDGLELRRLIAALEATALPGRMARAV
jgi:transposase-like protein